MAALEVGFAILAGQDVCHIDAYAVTLSDETIDLLREANRTLSFLQETGAELSSTGHI